MFKIRKKHYSSNNQKVDKQRSNPWPNTFTVDYPVIPMCYDN